MSQITMNGIQTAYDVHGNGEPVLFIHGFPLSRRLWRHMVAPLSGGNTLIMPDLRGMGQSQPTADATMATYADDLAALLDAIGQTKPVVVVGLSMGGYVAFEFFRRHGDRVRGLVLADTKAEADSPEVAKTRHETAAKVMAEGSKVVADAMTPKLFAKIAPDVLVEEWRGIMSATNPMGVAAALKAMAARADSTATLPLVRVPTLVIVGEEDAITPPENARTIHAGIATSQLKTIPDCGHMSPVEKPETFARMLGEFLKAC